MAVNSKVPQPPHSRLSPTLKEPSCTEIVDAELKVALTFASSDAHGEAWQCLAQLALHTTDGLP